MTLLETNLYVSYGQIAVFDATLDAPFNDWSPAQVAEGVSGSLRSVSFRTSMEEGDPPVRIHVGAEIGCGTIHIIEIVGGAGMEIATITDAFPIDLPDGQYEIGFSGEADGKESACDITIRKVG